MDVTAAAIRPTTTATIPPTTTAAVGPGLTIVPPTKSPEAESETPPRIQPSKPISFSNGVLKRHAHAPPQVTYKECLKNHAASLGGHALDGCGEFMPSPAATPSDPTSLKCAACGCHRNFHRRDIEDCQPATNAAVTHVIEYHPHHRHHPLPPPGSQHAAATPVGASTHGVRSPGSQSQSPPPISSTYYPGSAPHMLLALSSGVGGGNGVSDNNNHTTTPTPIPTNGPHHPHHQHPQVHHHHQHPPPHHVMMVNSSSSHPASRKRFRTKFTQEQKDKMHEFAEKVGWKMQKTNEDMVNAFCNDIGVERGVFKVWMHNNKNTFGKRSATAATTVSGSANNGGINHTTNDSLNDLPIDDNDEEHQQLHGDLNENGNNSNSSISINDQPHHHIHHHHHHHHQQHHHQYNGKSAESNAPTNGSSSSS